MRLVQLQDPQQNRRVALVDEPRLRLLEPHCGSIYSLAQSAFDTGMQRSVEHWLSDEWLDYDPIYAGASEWRLLPAFDHPLEPSRCMVSGTGLTHLASASNRSAMHAKTEDLTDSMRMYLSGVAGGRPEPGEIGIAPEWFYKGDGASVRAHGELLLTPSFADDGGEEPEIAGAYIIDVEGFPRRVGMMTANEFSDHVLEKRSYLYLAPSKLRNCAVGPELTLDPAFDDVPGTVAIERAGAVIWSQTIATGEARMCHSLANMEHHHFKYEEHRRPGDAHIHFYGASKFSFGEGLALEDNDVMVIAFDHFGRPLRNPLRVDRSMPKFVSVRTL